MRVMGSDEPMAVEIYMEHGVRCARLAKNAVLDHRDEPDGASTAFWAWDEVTFPCELDESEIESRFDELWYRAERSMMSDAEWRDDIESALLDLMEAVV